MFTYQVKTYWAGCLLVREFHSHFSVFLIRLSYRCSSMFCPRNSDAQEEASQTFHTHIFTHKHTTWVFRPFSSNIGETGLDWATVHTSGPRQTAHTTLKGRWLTQRLLPHNKTQKEFQMATKVGGFPSNSQSHLENISATGSQIPPHFGNNCIKSVCFFCCCFVLVGCPPCFTNSFPDFILLCWNRMVGLKE